ncbi:RadC family protein [Anoxynatronum sibiricum]|uniref:DNA repair protein RadC n=1 Tax=Anoxynatronum sibiricum TaxID=210623 RepID=A0ABU9VY26_9CLOT
MRPYPCLDTLSDEALLRMLIREKEGDGTVQELLSRHQSLTDLFVHAELEELCRIKGVGQQKARLIKVVWELSRRLHQADLATAPRIKNPDDVVAFVRADLKYAQKEMFLILLMNTKHMVIHKEIVSVGSLNASIVHPREVFKTAIKKSASALICVHNHPSGDPSPSKEDLAITKRLVDAGQLMGISVLDHIILAGSHFASLREEGAVEF